MKVNLQKVEILLKEEEEFHLEMEELIKKQKLNKLLEKYSKVTSFISFEEEMKGGIITSFKIGESIFYIVEGLNPYGTTNMIVIQDGIAIRHGNNSTIHFIEYLYSMIKGKTIRKVISKLYKRNFI